MAISLTPLTALGLVLVLYFVSRRNRSKLPLPPGPPKLPVVGNMFDIPPAFEWETYSEWSKKYNSDIIHLNVAGSSIIVLSSRESTEALLENRSSTYSDRRTSTMVLDLMGWDFNFGSRPGPTWRTHRRLFHQELNLKAAERYRPKELVAAYALLRRILEKPETFLDHTRQFAGEVIMHIAYGIDVLPSNDPYFTCKAKEWRVLTRAMADRPFAQAKRNIALGVDKTSFTPRSLRCPDESEDKEYLEKVVWATAGTMYIGGSETTASALGTFFLAMLANPEAQTKAQMEIDSVTQGGRLPSFDDLASLPYVSALVKEILRWKSITPITSRFLTVEDEYRGYRLPAGSIIIANSWAVLHDESTYADSHSFKPERFLLDNGQPNPAVPSPEAAFGFGRRLCPGRHLATSSIWIAVASLLATFTITKAVGEDGKEIEPTYEYFSGMLSGPLPFKAAIRPRSQNASALINATRDEDTQASMPGF
ncbi:cytochrome P450 [Mycena epipterygia]|nr:cytochrome P450 [Mycena epipterygia]